MTAANMDYEQERQHNTFWHRLARVTITTRVPSKWRIIDMETGQVYGIRLDHTGSNFVEYRTDEQMERLP